MFININTLFIETRLMSSLGLGFSGCLYISFMFVRKCKAHHTPLSWGMLVYRDDMSTDVNLQLDGGLVCSIWS